MGEPQARDEREAERLDGLLIAYRPGIHRYIRRRVRTDADADDLTQEVFVRMLRRGQSRPIDNVEGYLFQIAANLLRERGRQNTHRGAAAAVEIDPTLLGEGEVPGPERILLGREAYQRLVEALQELPERTRTVFVLSRFEEMTGPQIARHLGISISTVEKAMARAFAHLRARVR